MRDRAIRTDKPRDRKRTHRAKAATLNRKAQRAAKAAAQGRS